MLDARKKHHIGDGFCTFIPCLLHPMDDNSKPWYPHDYLSVIPSIHLSPQPLSSRGPSSSRACVSRWNESQTGVTCQSPGSLDALLPKPNLTTPGLVVLDAFTLAGCLKALICSHGQCHIAFHLCSYAA